MEKFDESVDENSYFNDDSECIDEHLRNWKNDLNGTKDLTYFDKFLNASNQPIIHICKL